MFAYVPTPNADVLHVAVVPPDTASALHVPIVTPLSRNSTVPVGVPAPLPVMLIVAVNVTGSPKTLGLAAEWTAVAVVALLTV
jgi:hypothetical protein